MMDFLSYEGEVAVVLLVFYLFFRFQLKKETFHRFNRRVLVGTAVLSFVLPLCVITIHRQVEMETVSMEHEINALMDVPAIVESSEPWWPTALAILFWIGVAFVLVRVAVSIVSIMRIIRQSELVQERDGCKVVVTDGDVKALESVCEELDDLVVSLIRQSPKWEPVTVNGKPTPQCLTIPITFQMR